MFIIIHIRYRKLSDIDNDGSLSLQEFIVAMKLVLARRQSFDIPLLLPDELRNIGLNKQGNGAINVSAFDVLF